MGYALTEVLAHHREWPYKSLKERWRLADLGLQILSATLSHSDALCGSLMQALSQPGAGRRSKRPEHFENTCTAAAGKGLTPLCLLLWHKFTAVC